MPRRRRANNAALLVPYALPYFVYVGIASIPESTGLTLEANYGLRLVASAAALVWAWPHYVPLTGPRSPVGSIAWGIGAGILGTALWVAVKAPFVPQGGEPWAPAAFALRVAASSTVVPLFEELLFRGYLLRLFVQWERLRAAGVPDAFPEAFDRHRIDEVEPGAWTPLAVALSTVAFASGHGIPEWPAAIVYGLLMAGLWIVRKDLLSCVVAHATTNLTLAIWVSHAGAWALW